MLVKDVMTKEVITITPDTSFSDAMNILRKNKIRRLPVVKDGKIAGIITEKDLLSASPSAATTLDIWELQYLLNKLKVKEIMIKNVVTVKETTPLENAAKIMAEKKIGALPVLNDNKELVGIITETDIFKTFVKMLGAGRKGTRYTFEAEDEPGVIYNIAKFAADAGANIIAISSYPLHNGKYIVVVKVENVDHNKFLEYLTACKKAKLLYFSE
ncbi:MAG: CBS domain-containing protein [Thermotogaceae bacterium]|nr:CBS domain-containing protein [Thermotogaceae bacterium]